MATDPVFDRPILLPMRRGTDFVADDHATAIETARKAYIASIRDNRSDAEITIARQALKSATNAYHASLAIAPEPAATLVGDVIDKGSLVEIMRESIATTLQTSLGMRGLALDPQTLAELARELARNTAQNIFLIEVIK